VLPAADEPTEAPFEMEFGTWRERLACLSNNRGETTPLQLAIFSLLAVIAVFGGEVFLHHVAGARAGALRGGSLVM